MTNIFTLENLDDFTEKLNIDDLYEKKRQYDLSKLALYNKLLNRIHVKIKTTSRQSIDQQFCWFVVPEIIIGVPKYDQAGCIAYLIDKLKENGFAVRYMHPNLLFICWKEWVPSYVRSELKKKTGIVVNEFGIRQEENSENEMDPLNPFALANTNSNHNHNHSQNQQNSQGKSKSKNTSKKNYTPIESYKPLGNLN